MLGPGTTVTHAAVMTMAEAGCLVAWCGEQGVRFYAQGMGETRSAARLLRQAALWAGPAQRLAVVRRMYEMRFPDPLRPGLTLRQIRGKEGARVRTAYAAAAERYGVPWERRQYNRLDWEASTPINRALSAANSCLYGVCHAAVVAAGYSPALGFIHTGKMLSFVYDVADLYKIDGPRSLPGGSQGRSEAGMMCPGPVLLGGVRAAPELLRQGTARSRTLLDRSGLDSVVKMGEDQLTRSIVAT